MRYAFPQLASKSMFQTYNIVRRALTAAGHEVTVDITPDSDAVLYSACDVLDMVGLRRLRRETSKPIIVGGSYAYNYWSAHIYADIVWIGEVFDFARLQSPQDIADSPHAYTGTAKKLYASQSIDWGSIPITQISPNKCYYWAGTGCKNKCKFCFTSWTRKHQTAGRPRVLSAARAAKERGIHLMITANEYNYNAESKTKDMLLVDYIKTPVTGNMVRCGIEFAREDTRWRMGKPITREEIYKAIQKINIDYVPLKLFHITGYEPVSDWDNYISDMCWMLERHPNQRILQLEFNNLQYQNYTPLYRERKQINPDNYITIDTVRGWYNQLRRYSSKVFIGAPSPFVHVAARMGIELSRTKEQCELWLYYLNHRDKTDVENAYRELFSSGVLDTPYHRVNLNTGEIRCNTEVNNGQAICQG